MEITVFMLLSVLCYANASPLDQPTSRIINGNLAAANQFPYAISLQQVEVAGQQTATRGHRCGGVLITLQHVLTTATCLFEPGPNATLQPINPAQYRIFAGATLLTEDTIGDRVRIIANFTLHPNYVITPSSVNDIAVITLTTPYAAGQQAIVPLALPAATHDPAEFTLCTVAGWGSAGTDVANTASTELRFAEKYIYNHNICTLLYNLAPNVFNIFPSMICAAPHDILTASCPNDNGNGLVCGGTLTGILFGQNPTCTASSFPELYTRVSNYTTWIQSVTGSASTFTPGLILLSMLTILQLITAKIVS